jgi:hypothetical protein
MTATLTGKGVRALIAPIVAREILKTTVTQHPPNKINNKNNTKRYFTTTKYKTKKIWTHRQL